jgi:polyisoprenoid-binding protein YceI
MRFSFAAILLLATVLSVALGAQSRAIDTERSTLTVFAYKSGLFSAFADDHIIRAPIASGTITEDGTPAVEIQVRSAELVALDPALSPSKRAEVQARMVGPDVLDVTQYPDITFVSTALESPGANRWNVNGRLTIHGQTRPVTFTVTRQDGHYRGTVALKQSDFGIRPISIVGGTVKVKDELKDEFDVVAK